MIDAGEALGRRFVEAEHRRGTERHAGRRRVAVVHAYVEPQPHEQLGDGLAALAEPDHQRTTTEDPAHRSFKVASASRASTKLMIQNRTITFGSAQPFSSK